MWGADTKWSCTADGKRLGEYFGFTMRASKSEAVSVDLCT